MFSRLKGGYAGHVFMYYTQHRIMSFKKWLTTVDDQGWQGYHA